jgi:hypothetical protein
MNAVQMPPPEYFLDGIARLRRFLVPRQAPRQSTAATSAPDRQHAATLLRQHDVPPTSHLSASQRRTGSWSDANDSLVTFELSRTDAPTLRNTPFGLQWSIVQGVKRYVLEASADPTFASPNVVYEGGNVSHPGVAMTSGGEPARYYRVKAGSLLKLDSHWSNVVEVPLVRPPPG